MKTKKQLKQLKDMMYKYKKTMVHIRKFVRENENKVVNALTIIFGLGVLDIGLLLIGILNE